MSNVNLVSVGAENYRYGVQLLGVVDGANQVFTTPEKFTQTASLNICVYYNGQRIYVLEDFAVSESGGIGTGFDTITTVFTALAGDSLRADYVVSV